MGFRLARTYKLRWDEGTDLAGLEIDMRSTSVETLVEIKSLNAIQDSGRVAELLAENVDRWNFEDENGRQLPIEPSSLLSQEGSVLVEISRQWYLAALGVSAPLVLTSIDSPPSAEESIPMETL